MVKKILIGLLALACLVGGFLGGRELERRKCVTEALAVDQTHSLEVVRLKGEALAWATAISKGEGEAILRAFVAGISPAIQAERRESLEISAISLLRVKGVEGVHIFHPDGKVLYSSDAKISTTGELGERGAWALAAPELISREGNHPGALDFAVPLISTGKVIAVIWVEYSEAAVRESARPPGLSNSAPTDAISEVPVAAKSEEPGPSEEAKQE